MKRQREQRTRGRHKGARSPETRRWEAEHLIPARPAWMPEATYQALARLRESS